MTVKAFLSVSPVSSRKGEFYTLPDGVTAIIGGMLMNMATLHHREKNFQASMTTKHRLA